MDDSNSAGEIVGTVNAATDALKNAGVGHDAMQGLAIAAAILGLVFLVMWGMKRFGNGKPERPEAIQSDAGAIMHAITGLSHEIAEQGRATLQHIDKVATDLSARIAAHDQRDDERFDNVYRTMAERPWDGKAERRTR